MDSDIQFLSVVAQSSATIVAVVAGFITGVVLSISSKREGLVEHIASEDQRRTLLSNQLTDLEDGAQKTRIRFLLDENLDEIFEMDSARDDPSYAWRHLRMGEFREEVFTVAWKEFVEHLETELKWLRQLLDEVDFHDHEGDYTRFDFDWWAEHHARVDPTGRDEPLLTRLYELEYVRRRSNATGRFAKNAKAHFSPPIIAESVQRARNEAYWRRDEQNRRDIDLIRSGEGEIRREIQKTQLRSQDLAQQLEMIGKPPAHLAQGFWLMIVLAFAGISIPLLFMMDTYNRVTSWISFGLFNTGMVALFVFMSLLIFPDWPRRRLRRTLKRGQPA